MPRLPIPAQALSLASISSQHYICRSCRAHALRTFTTTSQNLAEEPFWKRLQKSVFGTKEAEEKAAKREEAQAIRAREDAESTGTSAAGASEYVDRKGRVWNRAAVVDPSVNEAYQPASSWAGLEHIGSREWIKERRHGGEVFKGFAPRRRMELGPEEWRCVLHHVVVEVLALYGKGRDVGDVCREFGGVEEWEVTRGVKLGDAEGLVKLVYPEFVTEEMVLDGIPERVVQETLAEEAAEEAAEQETVDEAAVEDEVPEQPFVFKNVEERAAELDAEEKQTLRKIKQAINKTLDRPAGDCMRLPLADPSIKLTILKRITQITGVRLSDPVISSAQTLNDLYAAYKIKPAPKRLAETPELQQLSQSVSNITVHKARRTPVHKERQVGRWKVIEEELTRRGLPVTGSRLQGAKLKSYMPWDN